MLFSNMYKTVLSIGSEMTVACQVALLLDVESASNVVNAEFVELEWNGRTKLQNNPRRCTPIKQYVLVTGIISIHFRIVENCVSV